MIFNMVGAGGTPRMPDFTYTGSCQFIDDKNGNWRIKFFTSGTLTFNDSPAPGNRIDLFLVGGGGSGHRYYGGGGGGGRTKTVKGVGITVGTAYPIVIGAGGYRDYDSNAVGGGKSTAFSYEAAGGSPGYYQGGGAGGSGGGAVNGIGGTDGGNGTGSGNGGGAGQGTTTREFEEPTGQLYADGGYGYGVGGQGTHTEGGAGKQNTPALANTGGGGGGDNTGGVTAVGNNGGTGIVIIRNPR